MSSEAERSPLRPLSIGAGTFVGGAITAGLIAFANGEDISTRGWVAMFGVAVVGGFAAGGLVKLINRIGTSSSESERHE